MLGIPWEHIYQLHIHDSNNALSRLSYWHNLSLWSLSIRCGSISSLRRVETVDILVNRPPISRRNATLCPGVTMLGSHNFSMHFKMTVICTWLWTFILVEIWLFYSTGSVFPRIVRGVHCWLTCAMGKLYNYFKLWTGWLYTSIVTKPPW